MPDLLTRLSTVVGYSSKDCTCNDDGRPVNYNTSLSGYYSDEGEHGISTLIPTATCGDGNIWDLLTRARTDAINDFITHFSFRMAESRNEIINNKAVALGRKSGSQFVNSLTYKGQYVEPLIFKGLYFVIDNALLQLNASEEVTINIVPSVGSPQTLVQTTTSGEWTQFITTPIRLPLFKIGGEITYHIYYTATGKPINNTLGCGNCGRDWQKKTNFHQLLKVVGIQSDTTSDFKSVGNNANGLILTGRLECDGLEWIYDVEDDFFSRNPYGRMIAKCLQLLWGVKIAEEILAEDNISVNTQLSREHLYGKRNKFQKLANDMLTILTTDIPQELNHCYQCKDSYGFENDSI